MIREFPIEFKFQPNPAAPNTTVTTAQKLLCHFERFLPRPAGKPDPTARRFLLWSVVQLGDVVLDLAAARAIKRRFPDARVTMIVQRKLAAFAALEPSLDRVRGYDPRWFTRVDQHRDALRESLRLRRELATEQVAFVFDRHPLSRLFLRSTRIPWLVGCAQPSSCLSLSLPVQAGRHRLEEKLALLEAVGIPTQPADIALSIPEGACRDALEILHGQGWQGEKLLALCPGAGSPLKCWPPERFAAAANVLSPETGCRVLVLGSPDDRSRAHALVQRLQSSPINLAGETPVTTAAALLAHCHLVLTNDSGAMHLAAALGRPTVALFGPTDPSQWGPRGPGQSIALRSPTGRMEDMSLDQVVAAVRQQLAQEGDPTDRLRRQELHTLAVQPQPRAPAPSSRLADDSSHATPGLFAGVDSSTPIFVIGRQHSGNTLLAAVLDRTPTVLGLQGEGTFFEHWPGIEPLPLNQRLHRIVETLSTSDSRLRPPEARSQLASTLEDYVRRAREADLSAPALYAVAMSHLARRSGKQRWAQKATSYIFHVEEILRVFPSARLVYLARNPLDLAASLKQRARSQDYLRMVYAWNKGMRLAKHYQKQHSHSFLLIRYEDLVRAPEPTAKKLFDFCQLPFDARYLQVPHINPAEAPHQIRGRSQKLDASRAYRFPSVLTPAEEAAIRLLISRPLLESFYPELTSSRLRFRFSPLLSVGKLTLVGVGSLAREHWRRFLFDADAAVERIRRRLS